MSLAIRPARSTDAGKLGAMISEAVAANTWKPKLHTGAEDVAHMSNLIDHGWVSVCERAHQVAGFIALDEQRVQSLYVANNAQNYGIGNALLDHAKTQQTRLELWKFEANEGALRFYRRHGFSEVERTDGTGNDEGLPDIKFQWQRKSEETTHG